MTCDTPSVLANGGTVAAVPGLREHLARAAQDFGTPLYFVDVYALTRAAAAVEAAFPEPWVRQYSLKANDLPAVTELLAARGWGANVVSGGEWASARAAGVRPGATTFTGFGTAFLDYDNDGWLDVVAANGAVHLIEALRAKGDPHPLHQRKQLFHNRGDGHFDEATAAGGAAFELSEVGRGLAAGDLDNDGAIDFVVNNNNGPFRIFHNEVGAATNWFGLRLMQGKRDAYGARVEVRRGGLPTIWRRVRADGSYLSANDPRVLVGLGSNAKVDALIVHWPGGRREAFDAPSLKRYTTLVEGTGRVEAK